MGERERGRERVNERERKENKSRERKSERKLEMEVSGRKSQSTAIIEKVLWQILYFVSKLLKN